MIICITLDDVIRAKTKQIGKILKKYVDRNVDLDSLDLSTGDFAKIFGFEHKSDYNDFLYKDYPFEIFAEAGVVDKMLDKKLNLWQLSINENDEIEEKIEFLIANPKEFNASIGYTCFFLSKIATRVREFYFPTESQDIWDKCDVLITADKGLLDGKPEGKISVKIETDYNKEEKSDLTYQSLMELLEDDEFLDKILKNGEQN